MIFAFYINISDPAQIVVVNAKSPDHIARIMEVPAAGPHGLDLNSATHRLFCACDSKRLVTLNQKTGQVLNELDLSGSPDVIFFNAVLKHLYVAIGDPGVIGVIDTHVMTRMETVPTEKGAHTIAFDADRNKGYAFAPQSHSALDKDI
jgi:DNA-binding beta-propeller fold protein YncE